MAKPPQPNPYTTVVGLEVHVQLATNSKLFCGCTVAYGADPNTQTCPVCIGLPGSLPVINEHAVRLSIKTGLALNCKIPAFTKWDRKQYFYPDLPKGYQISQFDLPLTEHGHLEISGSDFETKQVRILRAHLEEDAGKSIHDDSSSKGDSLIDLNRTGTPLLEIVSEPDMRSAAEAKAYLSELKLLLTYIGVSDCNMQEGSLRVDANVNLHLDGDSNGGSAGKKIATPIVEIKNMNSFRAVERAIEYEAGRQYRVWQETKQQLGEAPKQTRGWDDEAGVTRAQRSKEESSDYRYFPDPDLAPIVPSEELVDACRQELCELPAAIRERIKTAHKLSHYDADVLVNQGQPVVDYFDAVAEKANDGKAAANWITQDVLRMLKQNEQSFDKWQLSADGLAALIKSVAEGAVPAPRAREVFTLMVEQGQTVEQAASELGIEKVDDSELVSLVEELISKNPRVVADVQGGKLQAVGALIGQAKKHNPNVDPGKIRSLAIELIQKTAPSN